MTYRPKMIPKSEPRAWTWKARPVDVGECPACGEPITKGALVTPYRRADRWAPGELRHRRCPDEIEMGEAA